jgi:hypothetical protein
LEFFVLMGFPMKWSRVTLPCYKQDNSCGRENARHRAKKEREAPAPLPGTSDDERNCDGEPYSSADDQRKEPDVFGIGAPPEITQRPADYSTNGATSHDSENNTTDSH